MSDLCAFLSILLGGKNLKAAGIRSFIKTIKHYLYLAFIFVNNVNN